MASGETNIVNDIMKDQSKRGTTLWRNVRGQFYTKDGVRLLIAAARSLSMARVSDAIKKLRQIAAGLQAPGSSDLIGFQRVVITQEMVGTTIAQFVVIEAKLDTYASPAQRDFCEFVKENGGKAGVARSAEDARKICGN